MLRILISAGETGYTVHGEAARLVECAAQATGISPEAIVESAIVDWYSSMGVAVTHPIRLPDTGA